MTVYDLNYERIEYGYRFDGPNDPHKSHYFDPSKVLLDPYAKEIAGRPHWMKKSERHHSGVSRTHPLRRVRLGARSPAQALRRANW